MQVIFEIPDDRVQEFIKNGASSLNNDELKQVMIKAVDKYLSDPERLKPFLEDRDLSIYGSVHPTRILENMLCNVDISKDCENARKTICEYIMNDKNHLITDILTHAIVKSLFSVADNSWWFEDAIRKRIQTYGSRGLE